VSGATTLRQASAFKVERSFLVLQIVGHHLVGKGMESPLLKCPVADDSYYVNAWWDECANLLR
jgi:hypothetical protein